MADMFIDNPYLAIGNVDYSSKVRSVKLTFGREAIEKTAGGDGTRINMNGLRNWRVEVTLKEDYAANGLDEELYALADAGAAFDVKVRPTTGAATATNPQYNGDAVFDGPYDLLSGSVGALAEKTIAFVAAGALTRTPAPA